MLYNLNKQLTTNNLLTTGFSHFKYYRTPINLNYNWSFGFLILILIVSQVITGIILSIHYIPHIDLAFNSIEYIMREINYGWLIRYTHANNVTLLFAVLYCHIGRSYYYNLYEYTKVQKLWFSGFLLFLLIVITSFTGYVLPWGQMSFWGATVITNILSIIPYIGDFLIYYLWGGVSINNATLNRFFILHFLLPFIILIIMVLHIILLHQNGSSNPLNLSSNNTIRFIYIIKEHAVSCLILLFSFIILVSNLPNELLEVENYVHANSLSTPLHLNVEWYFAAFYSILRAVPNKVGGILLLITSIFWIMLLPIISRVLK